eukprot:5439940-Pyramimonas_sp.AAC.1
MSQIWPRLALEMRLLPLSHLRAIRALAADALAHLAPGSEVVPMSVITAGAPQEHPPSGPP